MPKAILTNSTVRPLAVAIAISKKLPPPMQIEALPIPEKTPVYWTDQHPDAVRGLTLKVEVSGSRKWQLTYYDKGKQFRKTLGHHPDLKPVDARIAAARIRKGLTEGTNPLVQEKEARQAVVAKSRQAQLNHFTLGDLLTLYTEQLRFHGKSSARAVENCFKKNVELAFHDFWNLPAADVDQDNVVEIIGRLVNAGKLREAGKCRSYLRSAYSVAIRTPALNKYKLRHNPVAEVAPVIKGNGTRQRVLSLPELHSYWKRVCAMPLPDGAVLRFHLLTGGQRLEQLFRLTSSDRDGDKVTLLDLKGRRSEPHVHVVPLLPEAIDALDEIGQGPFLVSFDGGTTAATDSALRSRIKNLCRAMLKAEEIAEPFTPGDIRRTIETQLDAANVPPDHLRLLLSHGLGGVQGRYHRYSENHAAKLSALATLRDLLTTPGG